MTRILLNTLLAMLIVPTYVMAQKVYKAGTKVVLDMSTTSGMPVEATTTTPKTWIGVANDNAGPMTNNTENGTINATVYHKLEIAPYDMNTTNNIENTGNKIMTWAKAFNGCRSSTYDGGRWRLPTQRELTMLFLFQPAFEDLGIYMFQRNNYWSATEVIGETTRSYFFSFASGLISTSNKSTSSFYVRCVREIP